MTSIDIGTVERMTGAAVRSTARLGGGAVAQSYSVELVDGTTVFAKTHHDPPPEFFSTEAAGLAWLGEGLGRARHQVRRRLPLGHRGGPGPLPLIPALIGWPGARPSLWP